MAQQDKSDGNDDLRRMEGTEKAAVLLLSLGEEAIARLFEKMYDDEIRELSQTMANLGVINSTTVEKLLLHFVEQFSVTGALTGSFESTERLLAKVLPGQRVSLIMEEIRGPAGRTMWDKLGNVNEVVLANYLKNEYPQTVAVVLSKVKAEHAARVLAQLPESFSMEVVMRMLRMESVQKDVLDDIERTLRHEFMSNLARTSKRDVYEMMADIFNNLDRATESRFLSALEERSREAAEKVKALMFTFEDLARLDASSVQTLLRNIDKAKLGLCLKGASDTLKELFFGNMSERAGKILKEDMEAMGPVRLRDVEEAQMQMVQKAKELAQKGEIMLTDNKGDDELVY
jgi:flagellar motor switch protein FliG